MLFLALFTLTFAGTSDFLTSRRVVDIEKADFSFENDSSEMVIATDDGVENTGDLVADDLENMNEMMVDGAKDFTNMTEVLRRRMRWSQCAVYKGTHSAAQYLYLGGKCHHIQSWNTVHNWYGRNVYQTIHQSWMNSCRKAESIKPGSWLARGDRSHPVYAIYNGKKHHIVSTGTMRRCRFNWGYVVVVPQRVVDGYPRGPSISA